MCVVNILVYFSGQLSCKVLVKRLYKTLKVFGVCTVVLSVY